MQASQVEDYVISEEDELRAQFYALLSRLLHQPASDETLTDIRRLEGDGSSMGQALGALAEAAAGMTAEEAEAEFSALFVGHGAGGEVIPYLSHYLTGALYEKPLAALRDDMEKLGIAVTDDVTDPEDGMAYLCEMMHGLIHGKFDCEGDLETQRSFFRAHLEPWASDFFEDLENASPSVLYKQVGVIGRIFVGIEAEAFEMLAP